ncbi:LysE family transporter [Pullulanibacillus sp. KACC 23026]|uniref:LysE family transporter n=1 Tax=Pullulanibacillus sp. KACC 23026 TaxID=3028315 RepID=UPI0023B00602|nr:LysE family transporter [Pullulanibacillus sp. KACC 23026]WEG10898.1 LysE family transporter [Pullulanibacillus sp. KACC 23026]
MNFGILFSYVGLGLMLAAPIGPVNSARLDKGIKNGFWHAWIVGFGAIVADACFMMLVYLGLVRFINIPIVQIFLWLFGGFVLIYTGIEAVKTANKFKFDYRNKTDSIVSCFVTGFFITITSPLSILFWLGIYGSVLAETAVNNGFSRVLLYSAMIFLGITIWDLFVATLTSGFKRFFNYRMLIVISALSGVSLILFGVYFVWQGLKAIFGQ